MGERISGIVPFGEFKPDLRYLANDGLIRATNLIPVYGNYVTSPKLERVSGQINAAQTTSFGLHVDRATGNAYIGAETLAGARDLYKVTPAGVVSIVSKVAGAYAASDHTSGWQGASFGQNQIMTHVTAAGGDPVQVLLPGAALFADMIVSTFQPRGRFVFPLGQNLFLANCYLPAGYDGLSAGANPTLVCWSRSDDITQYGSQNANPEIIGAGYQPLNFDIGEITGAISCGDYGIIGFSDGIARVDGPPYVFRVLSRSTGTIYPNSMCAVGADAYLWSSGGPAKLVGGYGEPQVIGAGRWLRFLLDNATGFSEAPAVFGSSNILDVSMAFDPQNELLFICYSILGNVGLQFIVYNIREDRTSTFNLGTSVRFLRAGQSTVDSGAWSPGRAIRFVEHGGATTGVANEFLSKMVLGQSNSDSILSAGLISFRRGATSRITRIKPLYTVSNQSAIEQISVTIQSTNKPYGALVSHGPYTAVDSQGFIITPTTTMADWHSPTFTITSGSETPKIVEYEAFEYEVEIGGKYGA